MSAHAPCWCQCIKVQAPQDTAWFVQHADALIAETAPPWIRGALISTYQLFITLGIFLAACFNFAVYEHQRQSSASWRIVLGVGWSFLLILGIGILFFPETPRYAYRRGRVDEARETMVRVFGAPAHHYAVHTELEEIEAKFRAEKHTKQNPVTEFIQMFRAPRMAYRIALGMTLQMFQQLTGANYVCTDSFHLTLLLTWCSSSTTARPSSTRSVSTTATLHR